MTYQQLGQKLKEAREIVGHSQAQLAEMIGMGSPQMVANIESGRAPFPAKYIKAFCYWTDVTEKEMIGSLVEAYRAKVEETVRTSPQVDASQIHR